MRRLLALISLSLACGVGGEEKHDSSDVLNEVRADFLVQPVAAPAVRLEGAPSPVVSPPAGALSPQHAPSPLAAPVESATQAFSLFPVGWLAPAPAPAPVAASVPLSLPAAAPAPAVFSASQPTPLPAPAAAPAAALASAPAAAPAAAFAAAPAPAPARSAAAPPLRGSPPPVAPPRQPRSPKPPATAADEERREAKERGKKVAADASTRRAGARAGGGEELTEATSGLCAYVESEPWTEYFDGPLNATRWDVGSQSGLFHCGSGQTGSCTMARTANLVLNSSLPFYPAGNVTGAKLTLTQSPCNDRFRRNLCCGLQKAGLLCANWTGAHLVSRGCILYGTLTAEMSMRMPRGSTPFWDVGSYVYGGVPDPTLNEIDMIFTTGSVNASGSGASVFDSYRTVEYVAGFFNPLEHKQVFTPHTFPPYSGETATHYRNYSVVWTPAWMAWLVDSVVYMNQTKWADCASARCFRHARSELRQTLIPWRPQTIRLILRTADGTAYPQPEAHVFMRRLSYTPPPRAPSSLAVLEKRGRHGLTALLTVAALLALLALLWQAIGRRTRAGDAPMPLGAWLWVSLGGAAADWARLHWAAEPDARPPRKGTEAGEDARRLAAAVAAVQSSGLAGSERLPLLPAQPGERVPSDRMRAAAARARAAAAAGGAPPPLRGMAWGGEEEDRMGELMRLSKPRGGTGGDEL